LSPGKPGDSKLEGWIKFLDLVSKRFYESRFRGLRVQSFRGSDVKDHWFRGSRVQGFRCQGSLVQRFKGLKAQGLMIC